MVGKLLDLWQTNGTLFEGKTFAQVIQFSGDGHLRDGNTTSTEVREFLAALPLKTLSEFAQECLSSQFTDSGLALQDIINEIGTRLGFKVTPGRYRGVRNEVGFDGLWRSKDEYTLLVEVKTTDAYRINLDTIANYRASLIDTKQMDDGRSSILIIVGRQDTGDLEAQIRGSKHAWDIRLVSVDALVRLATVKEQMNDWATSTQINQVLRPMEYTRLDHIIELLFATSRDAEEGDDDNPGDRDVGAGKKEKELISRAELEAAREAVVKQLEKKMGKTSVRKGRALRSTSDGTTNIVCLISKPYEGPAKSTGYWYGFTPAQRDFLQDSEFGQVVLACADSHRAFIFERDSFLPWLREMLTTPPSPENDEAIRHWHLYLNDYGQKVELMPAGGGTKRDVVKYLLA